MKPRHPIYPTTKLNVLTCSIVQLNGLRYKRMYPFVENRGLEPLTLCLQSKCSTSWANSPISEVNLHFRYKWFRIILFAVRLPLFFFLPEPNVEYRIKSSVLKYCLLYGFHKLCSPCRTWTCDPLISGCIFITETTPSIYYGLSQEPPCIQSDALTNWAKEEF